MRRPRQYLPNVNYEITIRTIQGRRLLKPSPEFNDIVAGAFARAQELYPSVCVCVAVCLSTHLTYFAWAALAEQLPAFEGFVHQRISTELKRLGRWSGPAWGRRCRPIPIAIDDEAAMIKRFRYVLAQGAKEGLVWSPMDWPGFSTVRATVRDETLTGYWFHRDRERRERARGRDKGPYGWSERKVVKLSKLPCWSHLSDDAYRERVHGLVKEIEADTRRDFDSVLGVKKLLAVDPQELPDELPCSPAPLVHASTPEFERAFRAQYRAWLEAYFEARTRERAGLAATYPPYSFPSRRPMVLSSA